PGGEILAPRVVTLWFCRRGSEFEELCVLLRRRFEIFDCQIYLFTLIPVNGYWPIRDCGQNRYVLRHIDRLFVAVTHLGRAQKHWMIGQDCSSFSAASNWNEILLYLRTKNRSLHSSRSSRRGT